MVARHSICGSAMLFTIAASVLPVASVQAQSIQPLSMQRHAEVFARLDWTSQVPPSVATDAVLESGLGETSIVAVADDFGSASVGASAQAAGTIYSHQAGYGITTIGLLQGHSNIPAVADASFTSLGSFVFEVDQALLILLDGYFYNGLPGLAGVGNSQSSMSLVGPGGASIFAFTHSAAFQAVFTEVVTLQPGQYTLTVQSSATITFATGSSDLNHISQGGVRMSILPSPSGIALLAFFGFTGSRRRHFRN